MNRKALPADNAGTLETLMPAPGAPTAPPSQPVVALSADEQSLQALVGAQVGSYHVTNLLGRGGMGAVFRAQHVTLKRPAAIKVLLPQYGANSDIVRRFFNEAKASTAIEHPGIVKIYDFGSTDAGLAFIAMELLSGESLQARMNRGAMSESIALGLMRQMAGALSAAHAIGIIHRDLKPDNAYICPDPEVPSGERIKLLDFGIAKLTQDSTSDASHTRTGSLMGTPTYMSPEQCRGVKVDLRSDIYALGCILFHMITGVPPFSGEGAGDLLIAHIATPAPALHTRVANSSAAVAAMIARMLSKNPDDRLQDCAAVIAAIDAALASGVSNHSGLAVHTPAGDAYGSVAENHRPAAALSGISSDPRAGRRRLAVMLISVGACAAMAIGFLIVKAGSSKPIQVAKGAIVSSDAAFVPVVIDAAAVTPLQAATLLVTFTSTPVDAQVWLAGKMLGMTPLDWSRPADENDRDIDVMIRKAGFEDMQVRVPGSVNGKLALPAMLVSSKPRHQGSTTTTVPARKDSTVKSDKATNPQPHKPAATADSVSNPYGGN
jgi:serine/threonine protein kinase